MLTSFFFLREVRGKGGREQGFFVNFGSQLKQALERRHGFQRGTHFDWFASDPGLIPVSASASSPCNSLDSYVTIRISCIIRQIEGFRLMVH